MAWMKINSKMQSVLNLDFVRIFAVEERRQYENGLQFGHFDSDKYTSKYVVNVYFTDGEEAEIETFDTLKEANDYVTMLYSVIDDMLTGKRFPYLE